MGIYPKEYYEYLEKAYDENLSHEEREYYRDLAHKIAEPIDKRLEEYGMVA